MAYRDQSVNKRFSRMGDEAEGIYEQELPVGTSVRFGWNRNASFRFMENSIRHMPDYYANSGYLVEVMGGSGNLLRALKVTKWEALKEWNKMQPVSVFFWNSKFKQWAYVEWDEMKQIVRKAKAEYGIRAFENDGNEYYTLEWGWIMDRAADSGQVG